jgi:hypothetical protein
MSIEAAFENVVPVRKRFRTSERIARIVLGTGFDHHKTTICGTVVNMQSSGGPNPNQ